MLEDYIEYANLNDEFVSQYSMSRAMACICSADGGEVANDGEVATEFSRVFLGEKVEQVYKEGKTEEAEGNFEDDKLDKVSAFL